MGFYGECSRVSGIRVRCNAEQRSSRAAPSFSRSAELSLFGFEKSHFIYWRGGLFQTGRNLRPEALLYLLYTFVPQFPSFSAWEAPMIAHGVKGRKLSHREVNEGAHRHRGQARDANGRLSSSWPEGFDRSDRPGIERGAESEEGEGRKKEPLWRAFFFPFLVCTWEEQTGRAQ